MIRCFLLLAATATFATAADPATAKRDRDAAAVLALEMELAKPKPAKLLTFSEAMLTATAAGKPVIAYPASVRQPTCPPGAVCATTDDKEIIVGYPTDGGITIVERLPPDASDASVLKAFKKAKARGGPVPAEETTKDPFFIDLTIGLLIAAPPCTDGKCPVPAAAAALVAFPRPMAGPGPVVRTVERTRIAQRTRVLVGRFFFRWRR